MFINNISWRIFWSLCIIWTIISGDDDPRSDTIGYGGMVGSAHYLATEAGLKVLRNGGNAADAAIAVQMALNVVQPMMSGIGGGCFIVYYDYDSKEVYTIDGREEAPNAYHGKIFCKNPECLHDSECGDCRFENDTASYNEKRIGGLAVGVPGTLHALYTLYRHFGSDSDGNQWSDLLEPARNLSVNGFPMYSEMFNSLNSSTSCLRRFNSSFDLYYDTTTGQPAAAINETFTNQDFGDLLSELQNLGAEGSIEWFYRRSLAENIVNATNQHFSRWQYGNISVERPGVMDMDDINGYRSVFRQTAESTFGNDEWRGNQWKLYGMNMPSSGSVTVQYLMNLMYSLLEKESLSPLNASHILEEAPFSADNVHYLITANNIAFSDRNQFMADPDFTDVPVDGLLDFEYIWNERADYFSAERVDTPIPFGAPPSATKQNVDRQAPMVQIEHGTSHFFVVDEWNNVATVTTTIEGLWGSCIVVPGHGFLLNNELTDFDALGTTWDNKTVANGPEGGKRQRRNALDLFGRTDSFTFGGKRPRSSMSPSLVLEAETMEPVLSVGSPGGSTIIGTTFEVMMNVLLREWDVQNSIDAPRVWSMNGNDVRTEQEMWSSNMNLGAQLEGKGYDLNTFSNSSHGTCQAVRFRKSQNQCNDAGDLYILNGGADDRRWSTANVKAVCSDEGDGGMNDGDVGDFCGRIRTVCVEVETLSRGQRTGIIAVWVVLVVIVLCIVGNRATIQKWRMRRQNEKLGYVTKHHELESY